MSRCFCSYSTITQSAHLFVSDIYHHKCKHMALSAAASQSHVRSYNCYSMSKKLGLFFV